MTNLPVIHRKPPPVPPECSMAGHDWFPLKGERLWRSKWWRRASDLARARNVMMWWKAYMEVPAGSLPDDDDELAEAAGFGLDTASFLAHKAEIMEPWELHADGRWYHPTVVEMVLEAWDRKSESRKAAAKRQRDRRVRAKGVTPETAPVTPTDPPVTRDSAETERDSGTQDRTGQDITGQDKSPEGDGDPAEAAGPPSGKSPSDDEGAAGAKPATGFPVQKAYEAYNAAASAHGWGVATAFNETRRKRLQARLKEVGIDGWLAALDRAAESDFLMGRSPPRPGQEPFRVDLDFLLQAKSFQRLIEGKYDNRTGPNGGLGQRGQAIRALHEAAVELGGDDYG